MSELILVIAEQREGQLNRQSLETIVAGQRLASAQQAQLVVCLLGRNLDTAAEELGTAQIDRLMLMEHELLEPYAADAYVIAARSLIEELKPQWVLLPHTYQAYDFAPRLAATFKHSLIADCVGIKTDADQPLFVRQVFQGKMHADVEALGEAPHFVSFQAAAFSLDDLQKSAQKIGAEKLTVELQVEQLHNKALAPEEGAKKEVDLSQANIIVSVGRGIGEPENIELAQQLAASIGGELGASRPVCDAGWVPSERQVGSSGQTVAPQLYLALGISGASQHLVGMKGAKTIVAVNKSAKAPMFKEADYGIVGDVMEVIPALIKALEAG